VDEWQRGDLRLVIAFKFRTAEQVVSAPSSAVIIAFEFSEPPAGPISFWLSKPGS